jgi:DNA-binding transcriptional LysR family regulator
MDLDALRTFVLAVQLGSLTAARAVSLTAGGQSPGSAPAREAGDRLLVRQARGCVHPGRETLTHAQGILRAADDLWPSCAPPGR